MLFLEAFNSFDFLIAPIGRFVANWPFRIGNWFTDPLRGGVPLEVFSWPWSPCGHTAKPTTTVAPVLRSLLERPEVTEICELRGSFGLMAFHGGNLERTTDIIAAEVAERPDRPTTA